MISRGDVVIVAVKGPYSGKPRPAVVVQSNQLGEHVSVLVCLVVGAEDAVTAAFRLVIEPSDANGLSKPSLVQADRIVTVPRANIGQHIGRLDDADLGRLGAALASVLGLR